MGALTVVEFVTLDGVVQGFHGADERDGFRHSGWGERYQDPAQFDAAVEHLPATGAYLFGRRTYDELSQFWPFQPDENPMAAHLNRTPKRVVTHRDDALEWPNARRLEGDLVPAVQELKSSTDGKVSVLGSGSLVQQLLDADLVDELQLFVHPARARRRAHVVPAPRPGDAAGAPVRRSHGDRRGVAHVPRGALTIASSTSTVPAGSASITS